MYRCAKCGGLRVDLLPAEQHYGYTVPSTAWCPQCGALEIVPADASEKHQQPLKRGQLTLAERLSGILIHPDGKRESIQYRMTGDPMTGRTDVRLRVGTPRKEPTNLAGQAEKSATAGRTDPRSASTLKNRWSATEREALRKLIEKLGPTSGSEEYVKVHPERTVLGCIYQWNNRSKW